MQLNPETDWMYPPTLAKPGAACTTAACLCRAAKCSTVASGINYMVYVRGHPGDFDKKLGARRRRLELRRCAPYFRKIENFNASNEIRVDREDTREEWPSERRCALSRSSPPRAPSSKPRAKPHSARGV